ncbi:MAG: type II toxin-antitoxin system YafQ family toxin [Synergistaceae bacterium]|nr:type II toxin-antitoxin system YafQ family toxin [Synergistaceae bacterium]
MRRPEPRSKFRRDFKREGKGIYRSLLPEGGEFWEVVRMLADDIPLPARYRDHPLHGAWEGSREYHIRPDLLLVYTLEGDNVLWLERLGSHAELFGM